MTGDTIRASLRSCRALGLATGDGTEEAGNSNFPIDSVGKLAVHATGSAQSP